METEGNYMGNFPGLDYDVDNDLEQQAGSVNPADNQAVDYMLNQPSSLGCSNSFDKLSFADVMQFADFGPRLGVNQGKTGEEEAAIDPVYFLKFPVLNDDDKVQDDSQSVGEREGNRGGKSIIKRKRARSAKTIEEVESQRMTHIAVERNRRKQMNEHLRVLRSLMPSSYVHRGDQASIIGGAIEFVRELEQLLQCLESQKRRRLGEPQVVLEYEGGLLNEESAESKSCLADVEVKLLGFDALIKILSRKRPGQLVNTVAALEADLHLTILHTNITTIEQTVLYSFNVKIGGDARFTAEDLANSVQQIFTFIHANTTI